MADMLVIVPPELADGVHLAGARVWPAADAQTARDLLLAGLDDQDAGIVAMADRYFDVLDARTRRLVEQRYRPVVVSMPTRVTLRPEEQRREHLSELIRRAVGLKIVLSGGRGH